MTALPTLIIAKNAVVAKLVNPDRGAIARVTALLSYNSEVGLGWSGKSSFYDVTANSFPAGFAYTVQQELQNAGYTIQMVQKPIPEPLGDPNPIVDEFGNDNPLYDYQLQALRQVEKHQAGIIRVATGGGKSRICRMIMARFKRMTLFITTRGILLYQMKDQLDPHEEIFGKTGVIGDGQMTVSRGINLGMVQTLVQALEETSVDKERRALVKSLHGSKKKVDKAMTTTHADLQAQAEENYKRKEARRQSVIRFLSMIEVVIGEEAHEAGGSSYFEILRHCKNAQIRVALTATPFMRSSAEDNMRLMAAFGPVLIDVSEEMLINRGILAKPYFKFRDVEKGEGLSRTSPWERAYKLGYIDNLNMHKRLTADALMAKARGMPTLTLVLRKAHGMMIQKMYAANGLNFVFLQGEDDQETRSRVIGDLKAGRIDGIIGTTILDVGVDVPAIGLIQLAGGGKAEVALRQRIGRGLRSKKNGPNVSFIVDYSCNANATLWEHARAREAIIRSTKGFLEGIIEDEEDLPWHLFPIVAQKAA